jgi:RHS repeat-associated protein
MASIQGSTPTYYLYDGLGSTTRLADGAGAVTGAYSYDAFGAVRSHTGASTQWSFTGEQNDANGLEYLRARYYDPALGRFLTQDPWPGSVFSPQSLNPYAYVLNNPVNWLDPWGLRNVEGTPTPTPAGMVRVCVRVGPEGCGEYGPWVEIPRGGHGWALFPAIKEQITRISNWFNNTCPGQMTKTGIGTGVGTVGFGGAITPGFEWLSPLMPAAYKIVFGGPPGQPPLEACR